MMKIEKVSYGPWSQAYRCTVGETQLVVVTEIGPRVVSLSQGEGPNFLFNDCEGKIARGDWHIWGGHRFWIAPETEDCYDADNRPAQVELEEGAITITAAPMASGAQKVLRISATADGRGFVLDHTLRNNGPMLFQGAIWCLTCVEPKGRLLVPWGEGSEAWATQMVRYWTAWAGSGTDIESPQWKQRKGYFLIEPTGEVGKAGLGTRYGVLANLRSEGTFIKVVDTVPDIRYPDGGCNVELYTCGSFIEMETLSASEVLPQGGELTHQERWYLTGQTYEPAQWPELAASVGK